LPSAHLKNPVTYRVSLVMTGELWAQFPHLLSFSFKTHSLIPLLPARLVGAPSQP